MPYATRQQMIDAFGQAELVELTDRDAPRTSAIVDRVLDRALGAADEIIHSYIATRYAVPITPAPQLLVEIACDIARHRLYDNQVPEEVEKRAAAALRLLRDISDGRAKLPGVESAAGASAVGSVEFADSQRVFGRESL